MPIGSIPDVLAATASGEIDVGFVAIENAIEGSVNVTLDMLAFETDLLIQREVVIPVQPLPDRAARRDARRHQDS